MIYIGLDVSLNSVAICAMDETGRLIQKGTTLAYAPSILRYLEPWASRVELWPRGRTALRIADRESNRTRATGR